MKKYSFILIVLCLLITAGQQARAQVAIATAKELALISQEIARVVKKGNSIYLPGKVRGGRTGLYQFQINHMLKRRVQQTRVRAYSQKHAVPQTRSPLILEKGPVSDIQKLNVTMDPILKSIPYRNKQIQARLYLTAHNNRLYTQQIRRLQKEIVPALEENLSLLREEAARFPEPDDPMSFLAQSISSQINTLAIGEVHDIDTIKQFITQFFPLLRKANPDREIILFTEFLPYKQEYPINYRQGNKIYRPAFNHALILKAAYQNNIRVIGLDPKQVILEDTSLKEEEKTIFISDNPEDEGVIPVFASLTGIKWRNEIFSNVIKEYRAQHPDALFVIYAGRGHVNYMAPFSLTLGLDPQKTFVLEVLPTEQEVMRAASSDIIDKIRHMWDPLGYITNDFESFDKPFLYWPDPQLARIAGANVYIRAEKRFLRARDRQEIRIK